MKRISKGLTGALLVACFIIGTAGLARAQTGCTVHYDDPNIPADMDSDCDGYINQHSVSTPEGTPVDNCPNAKNGNCDTNASYCNVDGSYDGSNPDTLSEKARVTGYQADWDGNGVGDACDDYDGDGTVDYLDTCRSVYNPDQDPGFCTDTDNDGFEDEIDNCSEDYNSMQVDSDEDNIGDACDNCVLVYNPAQTDGDDDSRGDACPAQATERPAPGGPVMYETPGYQFGPDITKGGGGCSVAGQASSPIASILMLIAAAAMAVVRRKRSL